MNLFKTRTNARHQETDVASYYPHYLSHEEELVDYYSKYNDDNFTPSIEGRNPRNLFDDSDIKDHYWLTVTRKYIANVRL